MKFEISYPEDEKNPEPIMRLTLQHRSYGVTVVAVAEDGRTHNLLSILHSGKFRRCAHIDEDSGFKINTFGQLVECKNL